MTTEQALAGIAKPLLRAACAAGYLLLVAVTGSTFATATHAQVAAQPSAKAPEAAKSNATPNTATNAVPTAPNAVSAAPAPPAEYRKGLPAGFEPVAARYTQATFFDAHFAAMRTKDTQENRGYLLISEGTPQAPADR